MIFAWSIPYAIMAAFTCLIVGLTFSDDVKTLWDFTKVVLASMIAGLVWPVVLVSLSVVIIIDRFINGR